MNDDIRRKQLALDLHDLKSAMETVDDRMAVAAAKERDSLASQIAAVQQQLAKLGGPPGGKPNG